MAHANRRESVAQHSTAAATVFEQIAEVQQPESETDMYVLCLNDRVQKERERRQSFSSSSVRSWGCSVCGLWSAPYSAARDVRLIACCNAHLGCTSAQRYGEKA